MLLFAVAAAPALADGSASAFYVATGGRDSWSGRLSEPNADGTDGPFATLAAARSAMRAGIRLTYVRQGAYFLPAPLQLEERDSDDRIMAYPGEHATIYGGVRVPTWRLSGGRWLAPLPTQLRKDSSLPLLIVNGKRFPIARLPSAGPGDDHEAAWFFADSIPPDVDPHHSFRVRPQDAEALAAAKPGEVVSIFGQRGWQDYVLPIKQVDPVSRIITLDGSTWDAIGEGSRFAVLNGATAPGTWRIDRSSNLLEINPTDAASPVPSAVAATLPCIVSIEHARNVSITGLRFVGSATEGAAICLTRTMRVTLDRLVIADTGDGIRLDQATDTCITGSEITRTGGQGIVLRNGSDGTVVSENWIHEIGWLHQDGSAISFEDSSRNLFARNKIESVAKFGIGGGSLTGRAAHDNVIEDNEIARANQRTSDGGGIMLIGWAQDATHDVIRGNFVTATSALGNVGWDGKPHTTFQDPVTRLVSQAIYLDDWASAVDVHHNLLCGNIGGMELHSGWDNSVHDNILVANSGIAFAIDAENWLGKGAHPHPMANNTIERNTVILERPSTGQSGVTAVHGGADAAHFDHNIYAGPGLNGYSFHHEPDHIWSSYSFGIDTWRGRGQDTGSVVGATAAQVVLRDGAVRVVGPADAPAPLPLSEIGRPEDRAGLADRVRQSCGLR
jgi:hypothetical protein